VALTRRYSAPCDELLLLVLPLLLWPEAEPWAVPVAEPSAVPVMSRSAPTSELPLPLTPALASLETPTPVSFSFSLTAVLTLLRSLLTLPPLRLESRAELESESAPLTALLVAVLEA